MMPMSPAVDQLIVKITDSVENSPYSGAVITINWVREPVDEKNDELIACVAAVR